MGDRRAGTLAQLCKGLRITSVRLRRRRKPTGANGRLFQAGREAGLHPRTLEWGAGAELWGAVSLELRDQREQSRERALEGSGPRLGRR